MGTLGGKGLKQCEIKEFFYNLDAFYLNFTYSNLKFKYFNLKFTLV